jgi:hypothetical protein
MTTITSDVDVETGVGHSKFGTASNADRALRDLHNLNASASPLPRTAATMSTSDIATLVFLPARLEYPSWKTPSSPNCPRCHGLPL